MIHVPQKGAVGVMPGFRHHPLPEKRELDGCFIQPRSEPKLGTRGGSDLSQDVAKLLPGRKFATV
jgi:hypothetical protein